MEEKKMGYPRCSNCGIVVIGSERVCGRCGHPFTDKEIALARKEAGKCPGCGFDSCQCERVKESLEKDPESGLILIEGWQKYLPRPDSMIIPGELLEKPGEDVHLLTTNRRKVT